MKLYKQIHQQARNISDLDKQAAEALLWKLLCYAPKVPLRMVHEQLLKKAENFQLPVPDTYFSGEELSFNGFKWGNGKKKIFITHGWSSKAADFSILIESLLTEDNVQVIAFDAPGNGSSGGELSNLILYIEAIKQIMDKFGQPDVLIGHSLGALANMITLDQLQVVPQMLISIAPVIRLQALFDNIMNAVNIPDEMRSSFFVTFEATFRRPVTDFDLDNYYHFSPEMQHWIAYDEDDLMVDSTYLKEFLHVRPWIDVSNYKGVGHEKLIRHIPLLNELKSKMPSL